MQNTPNTEFLSLIEAADLAGVNRMTIWRAASRNELKHVVSEQAGKRRAIWVKRDSLVAWIANRPVTRADLVTEQAAQVREHSEHVQEQVEHVPEHPAHLIEQLEQDVHSVTEQAEHPQNAGTVPLESLTMALEHSGRLLDQLLMVQAVASDERAARERADIERERAQRAADLLRVELNQYQRALSESAESLAQQRAELAHLEAQRQAELQALQDAHQQQASELERQAEQRQVAEQLKLDLPVPLGWGSKIKRLLLRKVG